MRSGILNLFVFSLLFFSIGKTAFCQFSAGEMGINGLTCSQCSRSVEMELRKLDFLENIQMNLENTECTFDIKSGVKVPVFLIRDAVENAGFSVRFLKLKFSDDLPEGQQCFSRNQVAYYFTKENGTSPEHKYYRVLAAGFLPAREWKKMDLRASGSCKGKETVFLQPPTNPG